MIISKRILRKWTGILVGPVDDLPEVVHEHVGVIHRCISVFGANITDDNAVKRLVSLHIPDLNNKGMRTERLELAATSRVGKHELRNNNSVVGSPSQRPVPPLGRRQRRAVQHELLRCLVPRRRGLDALDVAAVAELSLGVGADDLPVPASLEPVVTLRVAGLLVERLAEHGDVELVGRDLVDEELGHLMVLVSPAMLDMQLAHALAPGQTEKIPVRPGQIWHSLLGEQFVFGQEAQDALLALEVLRPQEMVGEGIRIYSRAGTLSSKTGWTTGAAGLQLIYPVGRSSHGC